MAIIRMFAVGIVALCFGLNADHAAKAQTYPSKPIKIIVPATAGAPTDVPARLASQILLARLGQPIIIENRPGAGGALAAREVVKAVPDGYTLLSAGGGLLAVLPAMSKTAGFDPLRDFAAIANFMNGFQVLVVHPSSPWKSVKELTEYAKANPGKLNYAHVGIGHLTHLAGELFMLRTGTKIVGVPYRGGESATAVLSQAVHMTFDNVASSIPLIRDGRLRGLAVTSKSRMALMPDLPTMIEAGIPDYEVTTFFGFVAPAGTPGNIVNLLNAALNEGLKTSDMQETIHRLGAAPALGSPEDFANTIATHLENWRRLGKVANISLD